MMAQNIRANFFTNFFLGSAWEQWEKPWILASAHIFFYNNPKKFAKPKNHEI